MVSNFEQFVLSGKKTSDLSKLTFLFAETPFGQMPVLYVDGTSIAQSGAIVRYLAREFKQCGETSFEQAHVDMYAETFGDCFMKLPFMEKDPEKKVHRLRILLAYAVIKINRHKTV